MNERRQSQVHKQSQSCLQCGNLQKKEPAKQSGSDATDDDSVYLTLRRNLLSALALLNRKLGIKCCEQCGRKAA